MHNVFVYGTLKRGQHNHRILENMDAQIITTNAYVDDMELCAVKYASFPAMRPMQGARVYGEVYNVDDAGLARLDHLESEGTMYNRIPLQAQTLSPESQPFEVQAYVWARGHFELEPHVESHWEGNYE